MPPPIVVSLQFARDLFPIAVRTPLGLPQLGAAAHHGGTTAAHDAVFVVVVSIATEAGFRVGRE